MATAASGTGTVERIDPGDARRHVEAGKALLVCAYDSEDKFEQYDLDGAMSLTEFERAKDSIPKDKEIIFYCA